MLKSSIFQSSILLANISNNYIRTNGVSACVGVTCIVSHHQNTIQQQKFPFTQKTHNNVVFATIFSATPGGQEKPYPVRKPGSGQDVTVSPDKTYANSYDIWNT